MKVRIVCLMVLITALTTTGFAESEWTVLGKFKAGGSVKEIDVNRQVSKISFACTEGDIVIQSLAVSSDGKELPYTLSAKLGKGETQQLNVGNGIQCSKLKITDDGKGEYEVRIKR